ERAPSRSRFRADFLPKPRRRTCETPSPAPGGGICLNLAKTRTCWASHPDRSAAAIIARGMDIAFVIFAITPARTAQKMKGWGLDFKCALSCMLGTVTGKQ